MIEEISLMNVNINDLKKSPTVWLASVGKLHETMPIWVDFILPTEMKITEFKEYSTGCIHDDSYTIHFSLDKWAYVMKHKVNMNGYLEPKYHQSVGLKETDVFPVWFFNLKQLLGDSWSGRNDNKSCNVLKRYLVDNEYDYFEKKYPELII